MSRKVISINLSKCPHLYSSLFRRAGCIDICEHINPTKEGFAGTKGNMTILIQDAVKLYEDSTVELFGNLNLTDYEIAEINYLKGLI